MTVSTSAISHEACPTVLGDWFPMSAGTEGASSMSVRTNSIPGRAALAPPDPGLLPCMQPDASPRPECGACRLRLMSSDLLWGSVVDVSARCTLTDRFQSHQGGFSLPRSSSISERRSSTSRGCARHGRWPAGRTAGPAGYPVERPRQGILGHAGLGGDLDPVADGEVAGHPHLPGENDPFPDGSGASDADLCEQQRVLAHLNVVAHVDEVVHPAPLLEDRGPEARAVNGHARTDLAVVAEHDVPHLGRLGPPGPVEQEPKPSSPERSPMDHAAPRPLWG